MDKENSTIKSIPELEKDFVAIKKEIFDVLSKIKDKAELSSEQKGDLRKKYTKAMRMAKTIADRVTDEKKHDDYMVAYSKLSDAAASYGSAIKHDIPQTTFDDVKGLDNVKELVKSFMFMANHQELTKYYKIKGNLGMLMYGAPGTGKTMFAEAIANAMKLPLFIVTPADIFKSYVGASEEAVKLLFQEIEACEDGAILFIDECESIFSKRSEDTKDYKSAVTTELLQRMNGFGVDGSKRIMIAATNRPDEIDPAYLRYKRFSYLVHVEPPDELAKRAIIESKLKGIQLSSDISIDEILEMTDKTVKRNKGLRSVEEKAYYSAADLCGIIEEACRIALSKIEEMRSTTPIPLNKAMFEAAFNKIPPSISESLLNEYRSFRENINE